MGESWGGGVAMAVLQCCVCFTKKKVKADTIIEGLDLETWWVDVRHHTCNECYAHTCWDEVDQTVCFLDKGHPGRHLPWKDHYADVDPEMQPLIDLWKD